MGEGRLCYRLLYAGMLLGIVLAGAGRLLGIGKLSAAHVLTAVAVLLCCMCLQRLTAKGRAVCVLLAAVFLGVVAAALGAERSGLFIRSWISWLAGQEGWLEEWRVGYELLQTALTAFACYGLQFILERFLVIRVLTADLIVSLLLFCLLTEWEVSHAAVVFSFCYIAVVYAEWVQREWDKVKSGDRRRYMLWIMPFIGLYFVLMLCMPAPGQPYEWQFVRKTCSQIGESFIGLTQNFLHGGGDDFDTALSGFSGEGTLREELRENDRKIMTVQGTGSLMTNVYLTGKIYDTFDGKEWRQTYHGTPHGSEDETAGGFSDALQTQEAARTYEAAFLRDQVAAATLRIRYQYFRTSSLFVPLKTREIRMARERDFYVRDGDNLLFRGKRGYGTAYEVQYYQINAGAESFDRFLRAVTDSGTNSGTEDGTEDGKGGRRTSEMTGAEEGVAETAREDRNEAAAAKRQRQIYRIYAEEVTLSEETRQYVETLTAGAADRLERLRLLEAELASFTYTKKPRRIPEEADAETFLEYFLLEGREGYCTHFATAFVLLARAQGMPARYVQGFCVPMKGEEEAAVYSDMAHAWPEVYFDGVGWIPFEPTPGYAGLRYTPWATEEGNGNIAAAYGKAARKRTEKDEASTAVGEDLSDLEETTEAGAETGVRRFLAVLGYAVTAVCAAGSGILILQRAMRRRRYRRMDATGKFRREVAVNLRALGFLGLRREEGETLQEFRERILQEERSRQADQRLAATDQRLAVMEQRLAVSDQEVVESRCRLLFLADYEELLYGEKEATPEMLHTAVRERKQLLTMLRARKRWRYVFFRWRLTL